MPDRTGSSTESFLDQTVLGQQEDEALFSLWSESANRVCDSDSKFYHPKEGRLIPSS